MKRIWTFIDLDYLTFMRDVLANLQLDDREYLWLISDIDAYPKKQEYYQLIANTSHILLTTKELVDMLDQDDFQWVWAVFSAIPTQYTAEDILNCKLPHIEFFNDGDYNPYDDEPKLQHPYAELEIYCSESGLALVSDDDILIDRFRHSYPNYTDYFSIYYRSLKAYIRENPIISKEIYICNFLNCDERKMAQAKITIVKNILGNYIVTEWLDYEYGQYVQRKRFGDKDEAAVFAWRLFVEHMKTTTNAN